MLGNVAFETGLPFTLAVIPLYILMCIQLTIPGVSQSLYSVAQWILAEPLAINIIVLRSIILDVSLRTMSAGVIAFLIVDILCLDPLIEVPSLSLYLVSG
ncbi:MAG: hypothetical protein V3V25_06620 [Paracoccaceae bacterium]